MYNQERKERFLTKYEENKNTKKVATHVFNASSKFEESRGRDVCEFPTEELQEVVDAVLGLRTRSKWLGVHVLEEYFKWCQISNYAIEDQSIQNVSLLGIDKLRSQLVASPTHLQKVLDTFLDKEEEETLESLYRCYYWFAFMGVPEVTTFELLVDSVDFSQLSIITEDGEYPIYREAIPAIRNASQLKDFAYKHPLYNDVIRRNRLDSEKLMRGVKADLDLMSARDVLSKKIRGEIKKGTPIGQLTYNRMEMSGKFYRTFERERAGFSIDSKEVTPQHPNGKENLSKSQRIKEISYMEDYSRWKLAFFV